MMQYLDSKSGTRHACEDRERRLTRNGDWVWAGTTACGRQLTAAEASGECIAPMIDCGSCQRVLRREGWTV